MKAYSRREFLKLSGTAATTLALSGCRLPTGAGRPLKVGYISPSSGPLAGFGETDQFVINDIRAKLAKGLQIAGATHPVEILMRDSKSDPNHAADLALNLVLKDKIDLMLTASTPETTNPVSDQCEVNGVPCISTVTPWQPWYFRNQEVPEAGYQWTYHFFWGLEDIIEVFLNLWDSLDTNKVIGAMWPNDGDGLAWSNSQRGFPPALKARGYRLVDPGRYQNLKIDFSRQIRRFKEEGVEILTGVMIPPDISPFMTQCRRHEFFPKFVTVGKAALFPSTVEAINDNLGRGITTEVWWSPGHPFTSSLTGASASDLAAAYQTQTGKQWTQPLGFIHAAFEIAIDVLSRTEDVDEKESLLAALKATDLQTVVGRVAWGTGPTPNVAKTPLVGGQWTPGDSFPWELTITNNKTATSIPVDGQTRLMPWAAD